MIRKGDIRAMLESRKRHGFIVDVWHGLGLCDQHGRQYVNESTGQPVLRKDKATLNPHQFSLRCLAEGIMGDAFVDALQPGGMAPYSKALLEAGPGAVGVTAFANINAFTSTVAGLIEYKILEGYQSPAFLRDRLAETIPTGVMSARKYIGLGGIAVASEERKPGMPTKMVNFGERWVKSQDNKEFGLGIEVAFEAVAQDLTGDLLSQANGIGERLGYDQELEALDLAIGVTTGRYVYGRTGQAETAYNTYYAASGGNPVDVNGVEMVNNLGTNVLEDWNNLNTVIAQAAKMTDPTTGRRIFVQVKDLLVMPSRVAKARLIVRATNVQHRTPDPASSELYATTVTEGGNPYLNEFEILSSPLVHQRAGDSDGLNLSSTNLENRWWAGDFKRAFAYEQFHPMVVDQATPNTFEMLSRRIVHASFARRRGIYFVKDPRYVFVSTN